MDLQHKPALIIAGIGAIISLLVAFGVRLTQEQTAAILGLATTGLAIASAFWPWEPPSSGSPPKGPYRTPSKPVDEPPPTPKTAARAVVAFVAMLVACSVAGCTPAAQQTATAVAAGGEVACMLVASIEDPALEPMCATAEEIAKAVIAYVAAHGAPPMVATDPVSGITSISSEAYKTLAARSEIKARKVSRCERVTVGKVAP